MLYTFFAEGWEARKQAPNRRLLVRSSQTTEPGNFRVPKNKTPDRIGPGRNLSSYSSDYRQTEIGSQGYSRSLPALRLPVSSPTKARERCGPDGTRTRTL